MWNISAEFQSDWRTYRLPSVLKVTCVHGNLATSNPSSVVVQDRRSVSICVRECSAWLFKSFRLCTSELDCSVIDVVVGVGADNSSLDG